MSGRQSLVSRRNGRMGGPKTDAGKARSAQNARKHGILSAGLTDDETDSMGCILDDLRDDLQPDGVMEEMLVQKIALTWVQLQRCARAEAAMQEAVWLPNCPAHNPDGDLRTGSDLHLTAFGRIAALVARYDTTLTNRMLKLLKTLEARQLLRRSPAQQLPQCEVGNGKCEARPPEAGTATSDPAATEAEDAEPSEGQEWWPEGVSPNERARRQEPRGEQPSGGPRPSMAPRATRNEERSTFRRRPADGFWREAPDDDRPNAGRRRW
jgi:hypothetical protein